MTGQRIHLAAIVARDGRLLLHRPRPGTPWELPGGPLIEEHEDVDAGMDAILESFGVRAPAIEEDFVQTVYLSDHEGRVVYNIYAPTEWHGEPQVPPGVGSGWFTLEEIEAVEMDPTVRQALLEIFGVRTPRDDSAAILEALSSEGFAAMADGAGSTPAPGSRRDDGLDVLGTLSGREPAAAHERLRRHMPELADDVVDFALGEVWAGPALDRRTRSLQVVAMLAATGKTGTLAAHIHGALNHGATPAQLVETLRTVAVYAGFPAAIEAWPTLEKVFQQRGIPRPQGVRQ